MRYRTRLMQLKAKYARQSKHTLEVFMTIPFKLPKDIVGVDPTLLQFAIPGHVLIRDRVHLFRTSVLRSVGTCLLNP